MTPQTKLYAGGAATIVLAALAGFTVARMSAPTPPSAPAAAASPDTPDDGVEISAQDIASSAIAVEPAGNEALDGLVMASATVKATPSAEAVLTAGAAGRITRILKRIGDSVRANETIALVESRDASAIAASRSAAAARVTLASRQAAREKSLLSQGVSARADYETAQANLAVARAEAQAAAAAASAVRVAGDGRSVAIVSPVSGRIVAAPAALGAFVQTETELFRVTDPTRLQIEATIPAADAGRVKPGDRVTFALADGQSVEGRVQASTGFVDPQSRQVTVLVAPAGGAGLLAPGQLLRARIFASGNASAGTRNSTVTVPQDAVQTLGGRNVVFVRTTRGFRAQPIQAGARSDGMVEVLAGLKSGTPIATRNAFLLKAELEKNEGGEE
jgi:cobalt-zinc-cadmium efflux system membrane fusion protein